MEASLPTCCRRAGKHHCAVSNAGSEQSRGIGIVAEKCPYSPGVPVANHLSIFAPPKGDAVFAALIRHPAIHDQTRAQFRISFDPSRQKRGPPSLILL